MKKVEISIISTIVILAVLITATLLWQKETPVENQQFDDLSDIENQDDYIPSSTDIVVKTVEGNKTIHNFLAAEDVTPDSHNGGHYFVGNTFEAASNGSGDPAYVITYQANTSFFNIILLQKPFGASRLQAEQYLQRILQLDEQSMCILQYALSVPGYVDEEHSGVDYRFSFCQDSISLP